MSDPRTLRVLELDGGGERGYLSNVFLSLFVQLWGINPNELWKHFDVICGTSVGGLLALSFASGRSPDELNPFFTDKGQLIFSTNGTRSNRASTFDKLLSIGLTGVPFYATSPGTNYGSALLASELQNLFGNNTLQDLKTNTIIPTYKVSLDGDGDISTGVYTLCSNVQNPSFTGQHELISNVALTTSAAPFYLPSIVLESTDPTMLNGRYLDGGVYQNNPANFGRNLAQIIKPIANRCCVLSLGTGLGTIGFDESSPTVTQVDADPIITISNLFALFNVASTGGQESVSRNMFLESTYTLSQFYYYRFQPILDPNEDTELDNTTNEILNYYSQTANDWYNNDLENITTFLGHLTA